MKGLLVRATGEILEKEYESNRLDKIIEDIGCTTLDVFAVNTADRQKLMIYMDDTAVIKQLPVNLVGTYLYNSNYPICGDLVIFKLLDKPGEYDACSLTSSDIEILYKINEVINRGVK